MDKEYFVGLFASMIKEIVEHVPFICTLEYILEKTPVHHRNHAGGILLMVQDIFEDINEGEQAKAKKLYTQKSIQC